MSIFSAAEIPYLILLSIDQSGPLSRPSLLLYHPLHQIAQFFRRELIAFEIRRQLPLAIQDDCAKRMREVPVIAPEVHAKHPRNLLNLLQRPGKKMPQHRIGLPRTGLVHRRRALLEMPQQICSLLGRRRHQSADLDLAGRAGLLCTSHEGKHCSLANREGRSTAQIQRSDRLL